MSAIDLESEEVVDAVATAAPIVFPQRTLDALTKSVTGTQWSVPVEEHGHFDVCLQSALEHIQAGTDEQCEHCQRFLSSIAPYSLEKLYTESAVSGWSQPILKNIYQRSRQYLQLFAAKLSASPALGTDPPAWGAGVESGSTFQDMARVLSFMFDSRSNFHRKVEHEGSFYQEYQSSAADVPPQRLRAGKARSHWLVDLLNDFGDCKSSHEPHELAFEMISTACLKVETGPAQIAFMVKPFGTFRMRTHDDAPRAALYGIGC